MSWVVAVKRGKVSSHWEHYSPFGKLPESDSVLQRLSGECCSCIAAGRTDRDQHRWSWPPHVRLWQTDLRRGLSLARQRQPEGISVWSKLQLKGVCRMESKSAIEAPLLMPTQREGHGLAIVASFLGCSQQVQLHLYENWECATTISFPHVEVVLKSDPCPSGCAIH